MNYPAASPPGRASSGVSKTKALNAPRGGEPARPAGGLNPCPPMAGFKIQHFLYSFHSTFKISASCFPFFYLLLLAPCLPCILLCSLLPLCLLRSSAPLLPLSPAPKLLTVCFPSPVSFLSHRRNRLKKYLIQRIHRGGKSNHHTKT